MESLRTEKTADEEGMATSSTHWDEDAPSRERNEDLLRQRLPFGLERVQKREWKHLFPTPPQSF